MTSTHFISQAYASLSFTHSISQAYGRIDRMDPTCQTSCTASPFVMLEHLIHGSLPFGPYDGIWHSQLTIKNPGRYAIRIEVDGVTSPILFFRARSKAARLEIVRQPMTRFGGNASNPGDLFDVQPSNANDIHATKCKNTLTKLGSAMALIILIFKYIFHIMLATLMHSAHGVR